MDWNWFFSSFSQSAAALIGIIAAFIISKILNISEKVSHSTSQFLILTIDYFNIKNKLSIRKFEWYNDVTISSSQDLKELISSNFFEKLKEPQILNKIYQVESNLFKIDKQVLNSFYELKNKVLKNKNDENFGFGHINTDFIHRDTWKDIMSEKEKIDILKIEALSLISKFIIHQQEMSSIKSSFKPIRIIIILLMLAFPLTVIYPLHFMPVQLDSPFEIVYDIQQIFSKMDLFKLSMLFIFFLSIEGIFIFFIYLLNNLKKDLKAQIKLNTDEYTNIKSYSKYL
jgi:hypothetical protein